MVERVSLEERLRGHLPPPRAGRLRREAFAGPAGLRARIERSLDEVVAIFELDRLLYDVEVEALHAWLRRMVAFDAYCARRATRLP